MTPEYFFWLASVGAFLVGLSKGGLPAIGMLSVPLLSLVMSPMKAAVLLLPIFVISDVVGVWLYRRHFSAINLRILVPAAIVGILIGWGTASVVSERAIMFLIGLMGVVFCLHVWLRRGRVTVAKPAHRGWGSLWGAVSGFTSFISHAGAPPFQIYMLPQQLSKAQFAGTATLFFAIVNAVKIVPYQFLQPYTLQSLREAALLIPSALIGTVLGAYLTKRLTDKWFYLLVQISLFGVSVKLMVNASGWGS
ncbi:sulfite exporter TauE/SafE family protein [Aquabacterium sp.]|uniref:sulfite exporter TauE/SafE family protein n=1 Tax=Aquabacterium sp. TaxID=1872578 RepID=UPI003BAE746B